MSDFIILPLKYIQYAAIVEYFNAALTFADSFFQIFFAGILFHKWTPICKNCET